MIHLIAMKLPNGNNLQSILTATKMQTVQATRPAVCSDNHRWFTLNGCAHADTQFSSENHQQNIIQKKHLLAYLG